MAVSTMCDGGVPTQTSGDALYAISGSWRIYRSGVRTGRDAARGKKAALQNNFASPGRNCRGAGAKHPVARTTPFAARSEAVHNAHLCVLLSSHCLAAARDSIPASLRSAPRHVLRTAGSFVEILVRLLAARPPRRGASATAATYLWRRALRDQNIIGRSLRRVRSCVGVPRPGSLLLFHQPARQHGRGILLDPGIQQLIDFLAQVGGMAQPREFVALQRGMRSREQKLPRRLSPVAVQGALQGSEATVALR
jgi:hypothetical protein